MQELDQRDQEILHILQSGIPIASTPYAIIGQMIEMSEKEVLKRIQRLKTRGVVRQISAVLDARALGFETCLVAASVPDGSIEEAASAINLHPGVSQNYQRNHEFNLWFTIAVPPDSRFGLDRTVDVLGQEAGCEVVRMLPTLRQFRSIASDDASAGEDDSSAMAPNALSDEEKELIRLLQEDLPLQPRPFEVLAREAGASPDELLAFARRLSAEHRLRRVAATVHAGKPSFSATAMGVWVAPAERAEELARTMVGIRGVSQCHLRPTYDDWPYNLFTVVHGRTVDECESVLSQLAEETGLEERQALFPVREFKRAHLTLFAPELEQWEEARLARISKTAAS